MLTGVLFAFGLLRQAERLARPLHVERDVGRDEASIVREASDLLRPITEQAVELIKALKK